MWRGFRVLRSALLAKADASKKHVKGSFLFHKKPYCASSMERALEGRDREERYWPD